jgi:hypothetical protein
VSRSIQFDPAARLEAIEAAVWYDDQRIGLGEEFLDAIELTLDLALRRRVPGSPVTDLDDVRRVPVRRFPSPPVDACDLDARIQGTPRPRRGRCSCMKPVVPMEKHPFVRELRTQLTKRRAGQRLRIQARRRRQEVLHRLGRQLAVATLAWVAVVGLTAAFLYLFYGRDTLVFALGVGVGAYTATAIFTFQFIDPVGARLHSGLDGEMSTAKELRRLRRAGWRAVHNLHCKAGDVDHVAVGPGGVVVLETKSSSADWKFLERQGVLNGWDRQARMGTVRVKGLVKQHAGAVVDPLPLVVAWLPGQPVVAMQSADCVRRLNGSELREYLASLPPVLDAATVETITAGLQIAAEQFDDASGIQHPGLVRRMLGIQTVG